MANRAAYYARFSSEEQEASNSIELQVRTCVAAIQREGWELAPDHMFVDRARSGTTQAGREALQHLRTLAPAHAFDVLVVYRYDRLGRNFLETVELLRELEALGIRVVSATEGESPLVRNILLSVADNFSRQLSEVVRDGMRETALAGYSTGGAPPFGYIRQEVLDPAKRDRQGQPVRKVLWSVEESKAPTVRRIYSLYLEGLGFTRIAMALNAEGLPGPRASTWAPSAIREILHNPTYAGMRAFGRVRKIRLPTGRRSKRPRPRQEWTFVPNAHPAIVSPEIWEQVQAALARAVRRAHPSLGATRRARSGYPLVGLVKCGTCGANFSVDRRHNGAGRLYEDYVCGCRKNRGKVVCANATRISRATLDDRVLTLVKQRLIDPTIRERLRTQAEDLRARAAADARRSRPVLERELSKLEQKIAILVDRLTLLPPDAAHVVGEQLEQFGRKREEVRRKLVEADQLARVADALLVAFGATGRRLLIPASDPAQRSRIVGKAVERVLADLQASSPETVRDRVKAMIRQVTVKADGRVVVDGSWEPVVQEELRRNGDAQTADACVRTTLVPGEGIEPSWAEARGIQRKHSSSTDPCPGQPPDRFVTICPARPDRTKRTLSASSLPGSMARGQAPRSVPPGPSRGSRAATTVPRMMAPGAKTRIALSARGNQNSRSAVRPT